MSDPLALTLPPESLEAIAERAAELVLQRLGDENGSAASPWLSVGEAAEYLRTSERTLQRLVGRERIRSSTIGRRRLFHRDDLDQLARAATREDAAPTTPPRRRAA